jgi:hypothetical protein
MAETEESPQLRARRRLLAALKEAQAHGIIDDVFTRPSPEQLQALSPFVRQRVGFQDLLLLGMARATGQELAEIAKHYGVWLRFRESWSEEDFWAAFEKSGIDITKLNPNDPDDRALILRIFPPEGPSG